MWVAGEKISPIEVDAVLISHPDVAQAVAFGVPDDKYGEEVTTSFFYTSLSHHSFPILSFPSFVVGFQWEFII